jgi:hypothetical protein
LGASAVVFNDITDPATLETLACREAVALAEDLYLDRTFVVSDCKRRQLMISGMALQEGTDRSSQKSDPVVHIYVSVVSPLKVELQILKHTI